MRAYDYVQRRVWYCVLMSYAFRCCARATSSSLQ